MNYKEHMFEGQRLVIQSHKPMGTLFRKGEIVVVDGFNCANDPIVFPENDSGYRKVLYRTLLRKENKEEEQRVVREYERQRERNMRRRERDRQRNLTVFNDTREIDSDVFDDADLGRMGIDPSGSGVRSV